MKIQTNGMHKGGETVNRSQISIYISDEAREEVQREAMETARSFSRALENIILERKANNDTKKA